MSACERARRLRNLLTSQQSDYDPGLGSVYRTAPGAIKYGAAVGATRLEFAGDVNYTLAPSWSFFAQGGYQFAVSPSSTRRNGAEGIFGLHLTW